jgi:hypothetical protein
MNLPSEDLAQWEQHLREDLRSVVLREMADAHRLNQSALGLFFADVWPAGQAGRDD